MAASIMAVPEFAGEVMMLLSSARQQNDILRCRELGICNYLVKPVRGSELLGAIIRAFGEAESEAPDSRAVPAYPMPFLRSRLHILLAEDNAVNQLLIVRLLEKRGYSVVVASDGREAMRILDGQRFDLVLMDVQMPEMNGMEVTAAIRQKELVTGGHLPIIALTAHAMKGDQELFIGAGMDAYLSKPVHSVALFEAIERCVSRELTEESSHRTIA